jgi:hypothetical protein
VSVFPKEKNDECRGWSISYLFLDSINDELTHYENCPELEQIELVLNSDVVTKHIEKEIQKLEAGREVMIAALKDIGSGYCYYCCSDDVAEHALKSIGEIG